MTKVEQDIPLEVAAKKYFSMALQAEGFSLSTVSITVETTSDGVATCSATDALSKKPVAHATYQDSYLRMTALLIGQYLVSVNTVYIH